MVIYTALCIYVVSGYSNPNYPHIGRQCPCFCSIRSGDSSSPYWDNQFGGEIDEATCNTTTCLDANKYADYMPFCREVVTYKFCPRQFDNRYLDLQGVELISSLDTHARTCHTESMADPDKKLRKGSFVRAMGSPGGMKGHTSTGDIQWLGNAKELDRNFQGQLINPDEGEGFDENTKFIVHSARVHSGSSGGPLFDDDGSIIGLNTLKIQTIILIVKIMAK